MSLEVCHALYNADTHVGQRTYADYELGKTRIPLESMIKLAKHYDVSMDYICGCSDIKSSFPTK